MIDNFRQGYFFLSNFYPCFINVYGLTYNNAEAAFQAQKDPGVAYMFTELSASEAKKFGRQVRLMDNWEDERDCVMYDVCEAKFFQHEDLAARLVATYPHELVEGNDWGDMYWGKVKINGEWCGRNKLGEILMDVRRRLMEEKGIPTGQQVEQLSLF